MITNEQVTVGVTFLSLIFNVPLVLWLVSRATKKHDDAESEFKTQLTTIDRDVTIAKVKQAQMEREIERVTALTEMLNSLIRKVDKLQLDVDRAWEAIREIKNKE